MKAYLNNKINQLTVIENTTLVRKINSWLVNDWNQAFNENDDILVSWARKRLIVNHEYKFIYCAIPKNASSSLMKSILGLNKTQKSYSVINGSRDLIRRYVELNCSLSTYTYAEAERIINSDYVKFVIVRNPWARLVSAYINLFVRFHEHGKATDAVRNTVNFIYGREDYDKNITPVSFRDFIKYICSEKDSRLDQHCVPQYLFLGNLNYDFIIRMESLTQDLEILQKRLKIRMELPSLNKTNYVGYSSEDNIDFSRISSCQLRNMKNRIPDYKHFYNSELMEIVKERYKQDIEQFQYSFES